jgi:hypothetical protein
VLPAASRLACAIDVHPETEQVAAMNEKVSNQTIQSDPLSPFLDYHSLSLVDLLEARNLYHLHLTAKQGVIGTAVGRYFIRNGDSEPGARVVVKGTGPKTFSSAGIRSYSWPCIVVFVEEWIDRLHFRHDKIDPNNYIPDRLQMPDGRTVPVCVVEAPHEQYRCEDNVSPTMPNSFIGGGYPVLCEVQGQEHFASVGCLVTDGHLVYAVTNRHVAGQPGETIYALLEGKRVPIGVSSRKQLGRLAFESVYEGWAAKNVFINMDIGLIEVTDISNWVPQIYGIGVLGPLADLSTQNISLDLVNADVSAYGAASHEMSGRIYALFYRYGATAGFEYVSDILIGPRPDQAFATHHGDSGTLWVLDPLKGATKGPASTYRPLAVQWGGQVFTDEKGDQRKSFALGTLLSTVCHRLEVTPIRSWSFELPEYWGTFGHFTIANMACSFVGKAASKVRKFFENNLVNITFQIDDIAVSKLKGLSKGDFVPLADVPDLVWKMPSGTGSRGRRGSNPEAPNHFADMDQVPPDNSPDLLALCKKTEDNVEPKVWIDYANKFPPKKGAKTGADGMGLLPFRVWQLYDAMVDALDEGSKDKFLCAAGTLAHYIGDSCQPLHISYLHHGDPDHPVTRIVKHTRGKKAGTSDTVNDSANVHEDYEQTMFRNDTGETVKTKLEAQLNRMTRSALVKSGKAAAVATVALMQSTFDQIHPRDIVDAYDKALRNKEAKADILSMLWDTFGEKTVLVMADGSQLLACLWESAWEQGHGDSQLKDISASSQDDLVALYDRKTFLTSYTLPHIDPHLKR